MKLLDSYRWTDNSISIEDFYDNLPKELKALVDDLERADEQEDWIYTDRCGALENLAKLYVPDGQLTEEQFERLCNRYYGG